MDQSGYKGKRRPDVQVIKKKCLFTHEKYLQQNLTHDTQLTLLTSSAHNYTLMSNPPYSHKKLLKYTVQTAGVDVGWTVPAGKSNTFYWKRVNDAGSGW